MTADLDLRTAAPVDLLGWLADTGRDPAAVHAFVTHGIGSPATVAEYGDQWQLLAALPDGALLTEADLADYVLVGPDAWVGDPENRGDWAALGRRVDAHDQQLSTRSRNRRTPTGASRRSYPGQQAVTDLYRAGRSPSYGRALLAAVARHDAELDTFGFAGEVTASLVDDLLTAGIEDAAQLAAYQAAGLTVADAIGFASEGIPAAAVLMARHEGAPRDQWRTLLAGMPAAWFRPPGQHAYGEDASDPAEWTRFLRTPRTNVFTLADLRYLRDHGWDGQDTLDPYAFESWTTADPKVALRLAEHGLTWADMRRWDKALTVGKAPRTRSDATVAPLLGTFKPAALPAVFALHAEGVRPSHLAEYRKAGCTNLEEVLEAVRAGITASRARQLLELHGRQPSRWHATRVLDSCAQLLRLHTQTDA